VEILGVRVGDLRSSDMRTKANRFRHISCFNAENHILLILVDLEFEGHAVGTWKRNLAPGN